MNKTLSLLIIALMALSTATSGSKNELKWQPFEAGLAEARKTNRKVLIDVYTDWCRWCKKMDKDVYGDEKVSEYLSAHYVTVRLNAESNTATVYKDKSLSERELAGAFGVTGYPTTLFMEATGELITSVSGYYEAGRFINIARFIGGDHYKKMKFEEYLGKVEPAGTGK